MESPSSGHSFDMRGFAERLAVTPRSEVLAAPFGTHRANTEVRETNDGRRERVKELFLRHRDFVWRCLLRLGVDEAVVDDAMQDLFMVVYQRIHELRNENQIRVWLFAIARRIASHARRRVARVEHKLAALSSVTVPRDATPEERLAYLEAVQRMERFLTTLDEDKRMVFYLAEVEAMTAPEIASMLAVNLNTVYSRLRLAREQFRRMLSEPSRGPHE